MLILIFAAIIGIGSLYWFGAENPIEEFVEKVIEEEISKEAELTPSGKKKAK